MFYRCLSLHLSLYQSSSFFHLQQLSNIFQYNSVAHLNSLIDSIKHVNIDLIEYTSAYDIVMETAEQPVWKSLIFTFSVGLPLSVSAIVSSVSMFIINILASHIPYQSYHKFA